MIGRLRAGELHLHLVPDDALDDPALLDRWRALLTEEEIAHVERFTFPEGRRQSLAARALVRTALSRYAPVEPAAWRFRTNRWGRPEIDVPPPGIPPLRFNLSHTRGLVVCLVALGGEVGVDVERADRGRDLLPVAERFFSPTEVAALRALPPAAQRGRFLEYWTLKEAYIKARGMGLALPLSKFSLLLAPPEKPRIAFSPGFGDDPARWRFEQLRPTEHHLVSVAAEAAIAGPVVTLHELPQ